MSTMHSGETSPPATVREYHFRSSAGAWKVLHWSDLPLLTDSVPRMSKSLACSERKIFW
jgi:hypothetical protein